MSDENATSSSDALYPGPAKTRLLRYGTAGGVPTLSDPQIAGLFERLKEENLLETIMYSDNIDKMTRRAFVEFFKSHDKVFWVIFHENRLAGLIWLDDFGHRTARTHFCFFRWLSKAKATVRVAREALWHLLNLKFAGGVSLRVIRGETPAFNKLAVRFIRKVGLEVVGEIPHAAYRYSANTSYSMVISYINKDLLQYHVGTHHPEPSLEEA